MIKKNTKESISGEGSVREISIKGRKKIVHGSLNRFFLLMELFLDRRTLSSFITLKAIILYARRLRPCYLIVSMKRLIKCKVIHVKFNFMQ